MMHDDYKKPSNRPMSTFKKTKVFNHSHIITTQNALQRRANMCVCVRVYTHTRAVRERPNIPCTHAQTQTRFIFRTPKPQSQNKSQHTKPTPTSHAHHQAPHWLWSTRPPALTTIQPHKLYLYTKHTHTFIYMHSYIYA